MDQVYGYVRVSTKEQNEARQIAAMREVGVAPGDIYMDKQSGADFERVQYRRMLRRLMAFVTLLAVIAAGVYLTMTMLFKIGTIQVQTADGTVVQEVGGYSSSQILQALGVQTEENIFSFDPAAKEAELEKQFPLLESIRVVRDYPNTVVVQVTEAVPTYAMQTKSGWLTLSDQFKILACESAQPEELKTLYGGEPVSVTPGDQLTFAAQADPAASDASGSAAASAAVQTDDRLDALNELQAKLEEYGMLDDVTRMEFADTDQMAFLYQDRVSVLLGTRNDLDYKLDRARYVLTNADGMPQVTGQDCPSLPQVHVPLSILSLSATIVMSASAFGPLPMILISLMGCVSLPSSIK